MSASESLTSLLPVSGRHEAVVEVLVLLGRRRLDGFGVHVLATGVEAAGSALNCQPKKGQVGGNIYANVTSVDQSKVFRKLAL